MSSCNFLFLPNTRSCPIAGSPLVARLPTCRHFVIQGVRTCTRTYLHVGRYIHGHGRYTTWYMYMHTGTYVHRYLSSGTWVRM